MKAKKAMAAQFTEVTLDEIKKFLGRAFHALEPQHVVEVRGEAAIELPLSNRATILVYTSVRYSGTAGAGVGEDAIRVGLYRDKRPLQSGKLPIVKRTQNWRDNLRERVEDCLERYDTKIEDIEAGKFITW